MPTGLLAVLFSVLSAIAGGLLAHLAAERRNRRERAALGLEMTRQVRARYLAYLDLELRVTCLIEEFDRTEADFAQRLAEQTAQVERLRHAIDAHEGVASEPAPMQWGVDRAAAAPTGADLARELGVWQARLAELQHAKDDQLDRQISVIEQLTARFEALAPLEERLSLVSGTAQSKIELLEARVHDLTEQSQRAVAQREAERTALVAASKEWEASRSVLVSARDERDELAARTTASEAMVERLRHQLAAVEGDAVLTMQDLAARTRSIEDLTASVNAGDSRAAQLQRSLEAARAEAAKLVEQVPLLAAQLAEVTGEHTAASNELRVTVAAAEAARLAADEARFALELDRDEARAERDARADELAAARAEVAHLEGLLTTLGEEAAATHRSLTAELTAAQLMLAEEETQVAAARETVAALERNIQAAAQREAQLARRVATADERAQDLDATLATARAHAEVLEATLGEARTRATELTSAREAMATELAERGAELGRRASELAEAHTEADTESKALAARLAEARRHFERQKALTAEAEANAATLAAERDAARSEARTLADEAAQSRKAEAARKAEGARAGELEGELIAQEAEVQRFEQRLGKALERIGELTEALNSERHGTSETSRTLRAALAEAALQQTAQLDELVHTLEESRADAAAKTIYAERLTGELDTLDRRRRELERSIQDAEADLAEQEHAMAVLHAAAQDAAQLARAEQAELAGSLAEVALERDQLRSTLNARAQKFAEREAALIEQRELVATREWELADASSLLQRTHGDLERRGQDLAAAEARSQEAARLLGERQKELTGTRQDLEAARAELARERTALAETQRLSATLDAEATQKLTRLRDDLTKRDALLTELRDSLAATRGERDTHAVTLRDLQRHLDDRRSEVERLEARERELSMLLEVTTGELRSQEEEVRDLNDRLAALTGDLASTSGRLARKDLSMSAAANLLASLKPMLDAIEEQLSDEERAARDKAQRPK